MVTIISAIGRQRKMSFTLKKGFTFGGWLPSIIPSLENEPSHFQIELSNQSCIYSDEYWLFQAFLESMKNASISNPNPSIGCVIVKNNKIISNGCTEAWGKRHAERVAFQNLSHGDLKDSSVYVTLEPCTHTGQQPPCIELFQNHGITKVVVGCEDPNPIVAKNGIRQLQEMGIGNFNNTFLNEIKAWNYPFFIQQQEERPLIALKWAQTIDGCLADDNDGWKWISGDKSRIYAHWLRQKYDAILVGIGTVLSDFPSLNIRNFKHSHKRDPLKIIYDPEGKIFHCTPEQQELLSQKTLLEGSKKIILINKKIIDNFQILQTKWQKKLLSHSEIIFINVDFHEKGFSSKDILFSLSNPQIKNALGRPLQSVLVEGGARLLSPFIQENHFDVIHIFIAPFFLGGEKHKLFSKAKRGFHSYLTKEVSSENRFHIAAQEKLGEDILIEMIKK
jgi:diaminohydroxyphosphoribosylaminopyrimidine deaminase / 5-amino-6-(5-phosphoribosylamino)uracil reductase